MGCRKAKELAKIPQERHDRVIGEWWDNLEPEEQEAIALRIWNWKSALPDLGFNWRYLQKNIRARLAPAVAEAYAKRCQKSERAPSP